MKKVITALGCLVALLALGLATVHLTGAEAPRPGAISGSQAQQPLASDPGKTTSGHLNSALPPSTSPSPTVCAIDYSYAVSSATPVAATDVLTGCSLCITQVTLPFPFTFYGQSYTSAEVESQGNIQFNTADTSYNSCPFPIAQIGPAMFPYWSGFETHWGGGGTSPCLTTYGMDCGVYTSTSGSAPNRIFNIQWIGILYGSNHETVDFEARLHEGTGVIDFVYGGGIMFGDYSSIGIQDGGSQFVTYACNTSVQLDYTQVEWTPSGGPCATNTPTATPTITSTPTRTLSPTITRTPTATATTSCGLEWRVVPSQSIGQDSSFSGVAAIAPNDVWAVGSGANLTVPLLEHWNGAQWAIATSTAPAGGSFRLDSADGAASNDVWAVGTYQSGGSGGNTLTMHWDGTSWDWLQSPNGPGSVSELTYVSALAHDDVWAVGYWDNGTSTTHTLIEHYNGSAWSIVPSPDVNGNGYLRGVVTITPNNAWAVGNYTVSPGITQPLILHWDGTQWNAFSSPTPTWGGSLQQVAAVGPNDIWAVGAYASSSSGYNNRTLTMHWDGTAWTTVASPNVGSYDSHLWAVAASGPNDVWAVGSYNLPTAPQPLTMQWDGLAWNIVTTPDPNPNPSPSATPTSNYFFGVTMPAPDDVWAVGAYEDGAQILTLAEHYSTAGCETVPPAPTHTITPSPTRTSTPIACSPSWVTIPSQNRNGSNQLTGVYAISSSDIWAVGTAITGSSDGILEHWDGTQWNITPYQHAGFADSFYGIDGTGSNDVWLVGWYEGSGSGTLTEHWNGSQWSYIGSPNGTGYYNALTSVSARTASDVWAVGYQYITPSISQTLILHYNGTTWSVVPSPNFNGNGFLRGVSGIEANDVWAVGTYSTGSATRPVVLHWDGSTWSNVTIPDTGDNSALYDVVAIGPHDVWAVGNRAGQTLTLHWDSTGWSIVPSPNVGTDANYLYGVDAPGSNDVWAVGKYTSSSSDHTLTMHWDGSAWTVEPSPGSPASYQAVSVLDSGEAWAVGYSGPTGSTLTLTARYTPPEQCPSATPRATATALVQETATPTATTANTTGTPTAPALTVTPTSCTLQFSDVPPTNPFYSYIRCLACLGFIDGYPDGTFRPNKNVTRGQLAKIVSNAAGFGDPQTTQLFEDVPPGSTFFAYIGRLASRGYMSGYPCGGPGQPCGPNNLPYFRPSNNATRGQISKIVSNAAGFSDPPGSQIFADVHPGSTFYNYIQRLASRGVMSGYPCGGPGEPCLPPSNLPYFRPNNNATRGQTSKIVSLTFFPDCQVR